MIVERAVDTHHHNNLTSVTAGDILLSHRFAAVDTLLLDVSVPSASAISADATSAGATVVPFRYVPSSSPAKSQHKKQQWSEDVAVDELIDAEDDAFFSARIRGETRAIFGTALNVALGQGDVAEGGQKKKNMEKRENNGSVNGTTEREANESKEEEEEEEEEFEITTYRMVTPSHTLSPSAVLPPLDSRRRVLHLAGATSSSFYKGVSDLFALHSIRHLSCDSDISSVEATDTPSKNNNYHPMSSLFTHMIAYIHVDDGTWSVSDDATTFDIDAAPRMTTGDAIAAITRLAPHVVQPHMYDYAGMTAFRALFEDVLGIPVMGSSSAVMALSTHKARTLAVARQAGVPVAPSVVVRKVERSSDKSDSDSDMEEVYDVCGRTVTVGSAGELVKHLGFDIPVMVKPAEEDNSLGIHRACTPTEFNSALHTAFAFGGDVLVEQYIPLGREVRVGVVENGNGDLTMLPVLEYLFSSGSSMRTPTDKLELDEHGNPFNLSKVSRRRLPADDTMSDTLLERLRVMAVDAHKALGCTDYSIFDVRIDPNENVFMLESCLYCSFSHRSVLASMARAGGINPRLLFDQMTDWAISRRRVAAVYKKNKKNEKEEGKGTRTKVMGATALTGGAIGMKAR